MIIPNTSFTGSQIYRCDHILGRVDVELSADLYRSWGHALGQLVPPDSWVVVSADIRKSSEPFKTALIEGLLSGGVQVVDIGHVPSGLSLYAVEMFSAVGLVCVGGDWHSPLWNGLRWRFRGVELSMEEQMLHLQKAATNSPVNDTVAAHLSKHERFRKYDVTFHWIAWSQDIWRDANQRAMRILIDPMHGTWTRVAHRALQAIFPHIHIETLRDVPHDNFGGVIPNSQILESITPTCKAVRKKHVEFGIAIDSDAGNFTIIDNAGQPLSVEEMQWLFIRHLLCDALDGECLLHDSMCSEVLINEAIRLGATPVVSGMNSSRFAEDMYKTKALFGIMSDGSLFFRGTHGNRIVLFAISWLIDYMLCATFKLADWRKTLPAFNITPELRINGNQVNEIVEKLSQEWSTTPTNTIDGYSFSGTAAKVHIRLINGYEQLGFRFESKSRDGLDNIVQKCCSALSKFENVANSIAEQYKQFCKMIDNKYKIKNNT
ncbi:MAG: hypothetical protein LBH59_00320 [Planctomycetaceae bacterium]|jgi:phosphomannomutase/phosphoglucomutase|nr:hypothetical protein [Planctomycetaceae bacterium]